MLLVKGRSLTGNETDSEVSKTGGSHGNLHPCKTDSTHIIHTNTSCIYVLPGSLCVLIVKTNNICIFNNMTVAMTCFTKSNTHCQSMQLTLYLVL